jgi:ribonuclease T2
MSYGRVRRAVHAAAVALSFSFILVIVAWAEDGQPAPARPFDFYVLALSWSPTYCESAKDRAPHRTSAQCSGRPFAFVVHGLWPQSSEGFTSSCQAPAPRIDRALADTMLDMMPSRPLVYYEWKRHGSCTGLAAPQYFETLRKARNAVTIPAAYRDPSEPLTVAPADVIAAFIKSNPGLSADAMAVACNKNRLSEVRVCMGKDLSFHKCAAIAARTCKREHIVMPAARGE